MPERYQRSVAVRTGGGNPIAGAASSELARSLEEFSSRRHAALDRQAEEAGFLEGQNAGPDAEANRDDNSIRGNAFNRGVLVAHRAALQTDIRDNVQRFEIENEDDPDAFQAQLDGLTQGLLGETDPRNAQFVRERAADYGGAAKSRILARQHDKLLKEAGEDLARGAEGLFDDATTAAFEGNVLMTEARREELENLMEEGVNSELIRQGDADQMLREFERKVTSSEVVGNFDRLVREQGVDAGAKAIARWQKTKPSEVGLTAADHEAVTREMVTLRNRQASLLADSSAKETAAARAEHNARVDRIGDDIKVMRSGFDLDEERSKRAADDINALLTTGEADDIQRAQELARDFDIAAAIQEQVHTFRRMPAAARSEELNKLEGVLRRDGASAEEVALLDALQKVDTEVKAAVSKDPRGYLQRENLVEDEPLDFSSSDGLIKSLGARDSRQGSFLIGEPVGVLTAGEATQLAQVYSNAAPEERVALLGILASGTGKEAEATLKQLDDNGYKDMKLLGSFVMEGRAALARDIMRGQALIAADSGIKPKRTDYQAAIDDVWGSAMTDWPDERATITEAAFAKYAEIKSRTGDVSDIYNPDAMEQALEEVMPTARFNGRRIAIPPATTRRAFEDWTDNWDNATFSTFEENGVKMAVPGVTAQEMLRLVRDDGRLVELSGGRYGVKLVSASTGLESAMKNPDGSPFILEYPRPAK